ncbi:enterochelin esterase-like enzyme [Pleurocapsa sp. PCC 7327]|uniref:alpha/beta hydrolase n=1 Tax=Pleurocapsa sp. PCC 7327 TaxID=118163 RepID=UPI00029F9F7D|nr:enterochelin esterase-like enzyme [Pleurocapsa sp. PCC 7327]AFY77775.1 enterochelin esterase-like enzyme [Pleurocapsa sp. PCC 7327]
MPYNRVKIVGIAFGLMLTSLSCQSASSAPLARSQVSQQPATAASSQPISLRDRFETYYSSVLGQTRTYRVVLPPGCESSPEKRYPVIFLLHGGSRDETDWFKKGDALSTLQQLYCDQKLLPSMIITPDGNDLRGRSRYRDPQYIDGPNGKVSTAISFTNARILGDWWTLFRSVGRC